MLIGIFLSMRIRPYNLKSAGRLLENVKEIQGAPDDDMSFNSAVGGILSFSASHRSIIKQNQPMTNRVLFLMMVSLSLVSATEWRAETSNLSTTWTSKVTPETAWTEYPRPQLRRDDWRNLNGLWDYAITPKATEAPQAWDGKILVPFPPESALSGVKKAVGPGKTLWYRYKFLLDKPGSGRTLLHFGAVDYESFINLNGKQIGTHKGGFTPFSFDVTDALQLGENEILIRIVDDTEGKQLHGKQSLQPMEIWYPNITGIWQSVWLENVPTRSISGIRYDSDIKQGRIDLAVGLVGTPVEGEKIRVKALYQGALRCETQGSGKLSLQFKNPLLWSPENPHLYDIEIELQDGKGQVLDKIKSYAALREISKEPDSTGNPRLCINGKPIFLFGPLDQGWWPDGYLTPPSDEAVVADLDFIKKSGFNMLRKHVKVESARYYYHCDRLGIVVWQDQVSSNHNNLSSNGDSPRWVHLNPNPVDGTWEKEAHDQWVTEYQRMVDMLRNNPSVAIWSPFNEAWGQHQSMEIGKMAMDYDKTRLVCLASGGNFWPVGDIVANHSYPNPLFIKNERFQNFIKTVGEMGGHGWVVPGHAWSPRQSWGYGGLCGSVEDFKSRYKTSIEFLKSARRQGLSAAVYTQTTDVFGEMNGLMTFDRQPKVDAAWLKELNSAVMSPEGQVGTQSGLGKPEEK